MDATNRTTVFLYATDQMDLLETWQITGANASNRLASCTYNAKHQPLTVTDAAGQSTQFAYTSLGQLAWLSNGLGQVGLVYDTDGYLLSIHRYTNGMATNQAPWTTTRMTYDATGRIHTVTDPLGHTMTYDYDAADRPTKITYPDGTFEHTVYRWLDPVLRKDRRGHWTATYYESGQTNTLSVILGANAVSPLDALRRVTDVQDALNQVTHFEWCSCGDLESLTDPMGRVTTWLRDLQGRVTDKVFPDATRFRYAYETNTSRLKSVTDARSQTTQYQYNLDDTLQSVVYTNAVIATPPVSFTYDSNYNRLLTMTDGTGTHRYGYYPITSGQLGAGRLLAVTNGAGVRIEYAYDELGRVTNRAIDGVAMAASFDGAGRLAGVANALGQFSYNYLSNTFLLSSVAFPNGQSSAFSYHPFTNDYRLAQITNYIPGTNLSTFQYTYDPDGQIATWTQQAGATTPKVWGLDYDPVDQLLGATVHSNNITGAILKRYFYGYDSVGNRLAEQIDNGVTAGNFNALNQLTNTINGGRVRFAGQLTNKPGTVFIGTNPATMGLGNTSFVGFAEVALGTNLVPITATDFAGHSSTNRYQIVVTNNAVAQTLTYDPNGNLTTASNAATGATTSYAWDAADRLITITRSGNGTNLTSSRFEYDGLGRRVRVLEMTNNTSLSDKRCVWVRTELAEERDSTGTNVTKRFFGQGEQIGGSNYYFTRDHLGSVREMAGTNGIVVARYEYDPYGRRTKLEGALEADFAFTGHYYHAPSGLNLALYRAYDTETGRWLSRDPIAEQGGLNLYSYTLNDPFNSVDPFGLDNMYDPKAGQNAPPSLIITAGAGEVSVESGGGDEFVAMMLGYTGSPFDLVATANSITLALSADSSLEAGNARVMLGAGLALSVVAKKPCPGKAGVRAPKARSPFPIAGRFHFSTRKAAREAAERASPIGRAIPDTGPQGPHFHPLDQKGQQTHDHYYFPQRFW